jgi:hypothetical protein
MAEVPESKREQLMGAGTVALAWIEKADWPQFRTIAADRQALHDTYDNWLRDASRIERTALAAGQKVVRVPIRPDKFRAWCTVRGKRPDGRARSEYAALMARMGGR